MNAVRSFVARRKDAEEGFTLIELMVVVLIIAILIAIAIPQFLGARSRAQDRAAQSSLRNALTAAKTAYTDQSSYAQATSTDLPAIEPSLTYVAGNVASASSATVPSFKVVSVNVTNVSTGDSQAWEAAALSKSGTCFLIRDFATSGTAGPAGTFYGTAPSGTACTGGAADTTNAAAASW